MTLQNILDADSIAIIGASRNEAKRGYQAIRTLLDEEFAGPIYPVNPRESSVLGLRCYPAIGDIQGPVDLALVTTPAKTIPAVLKECGSKGVKGAVIVAGGFGEAGREGRQLEDEMVEVARECGIRLIGPNTSGMFNLKKNINLVGLRDVPKGDIALLTQSGNMALTLITEAKIKSSRGFSYYVGVGNEADIKFHEYLEYFRLDPDTKAVLMYVEGLREGRKFLEQAYRTTPEKPVVLLKGGRSGAGRLSAGSHTGALAGNFEVARSAFERAGIIVIENSDQLFPAVEALSSLPPLKGNSVAILADGGGHATIAADLLTNLGIRIPTLCRETREQLKAILPAAASVRNPVDVAGGTDADPTVFADCADILLRDDEVGGLLIVGLFGGYGIRFTESLSLKEEEAAERMGTMVDKYDKPIVLHSLYASAKPHSLNTLRCRGIPVHDSLEMAGKCIGALGQYGRYLDAPRHSPGFRLRPEEKAKEQGRRLLAEVRSDNRSCLLEPEARQLLGLHDVPVPQVKIARNAEEAAMLAASFDGKVVLKVVSPQILHKSDAGGVRVNLQGPRAVKSAYERIVADVSRHNPRAEIRGIQVSPMAPTGVEVIIGTKQDEQFGPVIMFGLGGVMVEILKDVTFRILPLSSSSAEEMITEIKSAPLLDGPRGTPPCDKAALRDLLLKCSEIVEAYPEILEMDLNPVIAHDKGLSIVDARIILTPR